MDGCVEVCGCVWMGEGVGVCIEEREREILVSCMR